MQWIQVLLYVAINLAVNNFSKTFDIKGKILLADNYLYQMDLSFYELVLFLPLLKDLEKHQFQENCLSIYIGLVEIFVFLLKLLRECLHQMTLYQLI